MKKIRDTPFNFKNIRTEKFQKSCDTPTFIVKKFGLSLHNLFILDTFHHR